MCGCICAGGAAVSRRRQRTRSSRTARPCRWRRRARRGHPSSRRKTAWTSQRVSMLMPSRCSLYSSCGVACLMVHAPTIFRLMLIHASHLREQRLTASAPAIKVTNSAFGSSAGGSDSGAAPSTAGSEEGQQAVLALLHALGRGYLHLSWFRCEEAIAAFEQLPKQHRDTGESRPDMAGVLHWGVIQRPCRVDGQETVTVAAGKRPGEVRAWRCVALCVRPS